MRKIGEILKEEGLITHEILDLALKEQQRTGEPLGEILLRFGVVSGKQLLLALSKQKNENFIFVWNSLDEDFLKEVPRKIVLEWRFIPIRKENNKILVASPIDDIELLKFRLEKLFGTSVEIKPISNVEFELAFSLYFDKKVESKSSFAEPSKSEDTVVELVNRIISKAIETNATDIHIEPGKNTTRVKYRIDGILKLVHVFSRKIHESLVIRLKVLSGLDISESRLPQEGAFSFEYAKNKKADIRVSTFPTILGEAVVLRILKTFGNLPRLAELGFSQEEIDKIEALSRHPYGMILISGPTGSGKTTTLYAILGSLFSLQKSIITIEDPPEIQWELVKQVKVNPKTGLTFPVALRSVLRQDPDIILIGEIRDYETADIAVKLAQTGHLILATVHANTSTDVPSRLQNLGVASENLASVLLGVISQRLVRKLCNHCRTPRLLSEQEKTLLGFTRKREVEVWESSGCPKCSYTGYLGRTVVSEIFIPDEEILERIAKKESSVVLRRLALKKGMKTMWDNAVDKVLSGITTIEEVERVLGRTLT